MFFGALRRSEGERERTHKDENVTIESIYSPDPVIIRHFLVREQVRKRDQREISEREIKIRENLIKTKGQCYFDLHTKLFLRNNNYIHYLYLSYTTRYQSLYLFLRNTSFICHCVAHAAFYFCEGSVDEQVTHSVTIAV